MSTIVVAGLVLAHAIGHVLFLVPALRIADWADQTGHSWALTAAIGDGPARAVAALAWSPVIVLFAAGLLGFLTDQAWWRSVTAAAAVTSAVGIVLFWDGIAMPSAALALAFDVLILIALYVAHWPAGEAVGA